MAYGKEIFRAVCYYNFLPWQWPGRGFVGNDISTVGPLLPLEGE